ncbi:MAG: hypothetical protein HYX80_01875 [Chloroflexi bacterium]|nr:hypothetical protein [Chloroflexota bacterium]
MPYAMVPPGYQAVPVGQAERIEDLGAFGPLEESSSEGALFLMRLDFEEIPSGEALAQLEQALKAENVEPWPGYPFFVYANESSPTVYLAWQKGFAWLPVIIGILVITTLPPILAAGIWLILPESLKSLISGLVNIGGMVLMISLLTKVVPAPSQPRKKPKEIEESEA